MLSKKQFDILTALEAAKGPLSQRALATAAKVSLGIVNKLIPELSEAGLIAGGKLTDAGLAALEPYRVKRAVFLAAGVLAAGGDRKVVDVFPGDDEDGDVDIVLT